MDFAALFSVLLIVAGMILAADRLFFKSRRQRAAAGAIASEPILIYYTRSFFPVIVIVLLVRSFVFEPFRIPSASMMPGLVDGDFIVVSKFSYALRLPLINAKIATMGAPRRGDVIVFLLPSDRSVHLIKRLIALPGDRVSVRDNRISINGVQVPITPDGSYSGGHGFDGAALALETFGADPHLVLFAADRRATDFEAVVPAGHYFFMGDNRNDSDDSRFPNVGFVPEQNLVGKAARIWMNWRLPGWPEWHRIGTRIR